MNFALLFVSVLSVARAHLTERFIYFPDDDEGVLQFVDLQGPVDVDAINSYKHTKRNKYFLHTRKFGNVIIILGDEVNLGYSGFDNNKEVVIIVHGWRGHAKNKMSVMLTEAFLEAFDCNVIVLDWSALAYRNYVTARYGVPKVGKGLGVFLKWLKTLGVDYNQMHLVGFSLGGHLIGNAGREVQGNVRRITALDPAGPLWYFSDDRIKQTDAQYVEIIHTNAGVFGYSHPCGDVDYYPNGGSRMPGCLFNTCSHSKAYEYMAATVKCNNLIGNECHTMRDVKKNTCTGRPLPIGNGDINKNGSGLYRVNTARVHPF